MRESFSRAEERWPRMQAWAREHAPSSRPYPDRWGELEEGFHSQERRETERRLRREFLERALGEGLGEGQPLAQIALDAGCGLGTYTASLRQEFAWTLSLDADDARLQRCQEQVEALPQHLLVAVPLEDPLLRHEALQEAFSLVHCMQVLGHVSLEAVGPILENFHSLLHREGWLLLALPYANGDYDEFQVCARNAEGLPQGQDTPPDHFEQLVQTPRQGQLPVHHFCLPGLEQLLAQTGWQIAHLQPYNWISYSLADLLLLARKR